MTAGGLEEDPARSEADDYEGSVQEDSRKAETCAANPALKGSGGEDRLIESRSSDLIEKPEKSSSAEEEEEEAEEACPFCVFMQGGACGERFAKWEACVDRAEAEGASMIDRCARATRLLTQCMRANADYYGAVLDAEHVMDGLAGNVEVVAEKDLGGFGSGAEDPTEKDRGEADAEMAATTPIVDAVGSV